MTYGDFEILYLLKNGKSYQPKEISQLLGNTPAGISRVLKNLSNKEYISYVYDVGDRRSVSICLTSKGKEKIQSFLDLEIFAT